MWGMEAQGAHSTPCKKAVPAVLVPSPPCSQHSVLTYCTSAAHFLSSLLLHGSLAPPWLRTVATDVTALHATQAGVQSHPVCPLCGSTTRVHTFLDGSDAASSTWAPGSSACTHCDALHSTPIAPSLASAALNSPARGHPLQKRRGRTGVAGEGARDAVEGWLQLTNTDTSSQCSSVDPSPHARYGLRAVVTAPARLFTVLFRSRAVQFLLVSAATTAVAHRALPPAAVFVRGSRVRGTAARVMGLLLLRKFLMFRLGGRPAQRPRRSTSSSGASAQTAVAELGLPPMPWLTEDTAMRLLVNEGDLSKARARGVVINNWRMAVGLDRLSFPPVHPQLLSTTQHSARAAAATGSSPGTGRHKSGRWAGGLWGGAHHATLPSAPPPPGTALSPVHAPRHRTPPHPPHEHHHHHHHHQHNRHHGSSVGASPQVSCPAWEAAQRFPAVARALGAHLVHLDTAHGYAVLWVQGSALGAARNTLFQLVGPHAAHAPQPPSGQPGWQAAVAVHVAVMSDWLWRARLAHYPLSGGRYVQVIDLKGLRVSTALGDGLALLRGIISASAYYLQRLQATLIINPPPGLALAWHLVAQLLQPVVAAKIKVVRGGPTAITAALSQYMPPELIPAECGGDWTHPLGTHMAQRELEVAVAGAQLLPPPL